MKQIYCLSISNWRRVKNKIKQNKTTTKQNKNKNKKKKTEKHKKKHVKYFQMCLTDFSGTNGKTVDKKVP